MAAGCSYAAFLPLKVEVKECSTMPSKVMISFPMNSWLLVFVAGTVDKKNQKNEVEPVLRSLAGTMSLFYISYDQTGRTFFVPQLPQVAG